jgi:uncharacterized protein GlcG (DUF336 family)
MEGASMKKTICLWLILTPLLALAELDTADVASVLRWRVIQITGKDQPELLTTVVDDKGVHPAWKLTNALPDAAYITANAATAKAYLANRSKDDKAAIKEVSPEVVKAIVAAIVKTVNKRLPQDKQISAPEMTDAIKGELP